MRNNIQHGIGKLLGNQKLYLRQTLVKVLRVQSIMNVSDSSLNYRGVKNHLGDS